MSFLNKSAFVRFFEYIRKNDFMMTLMLLGFFGGAIAFWVSYQITGKFYLFGVLYVTNWILGELAGFLSKYDWSTHQTSFKLMSFFWGIVLSPIMAALALILGTIQYFS